MKTEHLSTDKPAKTKDEKHDRALEDSFPTSDPPSFSPGTVGATTPSGDKNKNSASQSHKEHKE